MAIAMTECYVYTGVDVDRERCRGGIVLQWKSIPGCSKGAKGSKIKLEASMEVSMAFNAF